MLRDGPNMAEKGGGSSPEPAFCLLQGAESLVVGCKGPLTLWRGLQTFKASTSHRFISVCGRKAAYGWVSRTTDPGQRG